ncbi:hypothetical protein KRZ98_20315 [Sphingobium sp. AS12]|uniref:hypothetical protein n=1 Tax=Sphingobium sp. AS12 TaxID=2849495 RepID=UPI001C3188EE|nr:hypothetical protein [Sphingobium sp. AS12]MBV2150551.1 hypothetical protein [Sphingobium sp. AS12]
MNTVINAAIPIVLAAILSYAVWSYKSLITFKVTKISFDVGIKENKISYGEGIDKYSAKSISAFELIVENKGLKGIKNFKMHSDVDIRPFSINKYSSKVAKSDILISDLDGGIEVQIGYFPSKSEVKITFASMGSILHLSNFSGNGENYYVKSIYYWEGFDGAKNAVVKSFALGAFIYFAIVIGASLMVTPKKAITPASQSARPSEISDKKAQIR